MRNNQQISHVDPIRLEIFRHLFSSIAEEMGAVLRKSSFSPNIKERRDFSCALFDSEGNMIAQAAHIPVHLGSMPLSVASAISKFSTPGNPLLPGDTIILNDPFLGGTHLPDITLVTPVFIDQDVHNPTLSNAYPMIGTVKPFAYVASRAHHADVGGISPGSMPVSNEIFQEGIIIPPIKLITGEILDRDIFDFILANVRTPEERSGDLQAQIGSNQRGVKLVSELIMRYGALDVKMFMQELLNYTERMMRSVINKIPDGKYRFEDHLDNNGIDNFPVLIKAMITIKGDSAEVDFTGSDKQQKGSINAVYAITLSAVNYVFHSLIGLDVPNNSGSMLPIKIIAPDGSVVNAVKPAAVAGGNVETSQRIVDVLLGALAKVCPDRIPAASQGTMNNVSIGGWDPNHERYFTYYETIGGGMGASKAADGISSIHSHMTNTLNTPVEALEYAYPLRVTRYEIRMGSGGGGTHTGGDGIIRDIELLTDAQVTLLTERRIIAPYGLNGGMPGQRGENVLIHSGAETNLPGKGSFNLKNGDVLSIRTPGGGGFGSDEL